jgi:UDP-N-acetylmuramate--alanine ligase
MGAGGIGMSALMEFAHARGALVSGCDEARDGQVEHLRRVGLEIAAGHAPQHADEADELVYTPAVPSNHPELVRARSMGKPTHARMAMLGRLARGCAAVCVTGSHGKTTTTWMIAHLLIRAGRDPTVLVGGVVPSLGSNFRLGAFDGRPRSELVIEADESDNRLGELVPTWPVATNIDNDHLDHFGSLESLRDATSRFLESAARSGDRRAALFACGDDAPARHALERAAASTGLPHWDYGFSRARRVRAERVQLGELWSRFDARGPFGLFSKLELPMPGRHNVLNALAAIAVAWRMGLSEEAIRAGLATCERVGRRFEIKGCVGGVRVIDDYGHHPTEIAATLRAARAAGRGRLAVLFQPHRYTRTALLMDRFARCLADSGAELIVLLPVYAASEPPLPDASHTVLARRIRALGRRRVEALDSRRQAVALLREWAQAGDTVLVQGAGDVTRAGAELVEAIGRSGAGH